MALSSDERIIVEAIKKAPVVEIVIPGYDGAVESTRIKLVGKKAAHDIALSVQSYFVNLGQSEPPRWRSKKVSFRDGNKY